MSARNRRCIKFNNKGSGGGSVGRVVASNSRGKQFESSHRQTFKMYIYCIEKTKIKKKGPGMDHLKKPLITNEVSIKFLKALI